MREHMSADALDEHPVESQVRARFLDFAYGLSPKAESHQPERNVDEIGPTKLLDQNFMRPAVPCLFVMPLDDEIDRFGPILLALLPQKLGGARARWRQVIPRAVEPNANVVERGGNTQQIGPSARLPVMIERFRLVTQ